MSEDNTVSYTLNEIREKIERGEDRTDWARVNAMTDDEIEKAARDDPDWEGLLDIDWSKAVWVVPATRKTALSLRLDPDVLDFFKASGRGYQTRINAVLRHYMNERQKNKTG